MPGTALESLGQDEFDFGSEGVERTLQLQGFGGEGGAGVQSRGDAAEPVLPECQQTVFAADCLPPGTLYPYPARMSFEGASQMSVWMLSWYRQHHWL